MGQPSAPYSQPSAPMSQSSAPMSQPSAPYSQPSAPYSQPSASYEHTAPLPPMDAFAAQQAPQAQQPAPQPVAAWAQPLVDNAGQRTEGGLKAIFDISFRTYATPTIAKIIYVLVMAFAALSWLAGSFGLVVTGMRAMDSYGGDEIGGLFVGLGVVGFLFGWIPALLQVVFTRIFLELALANIRTAEDVDAIRTKTGA